MSRILIGTNHLARLSGSETVALEFAEHFQSLGHEVVVFANWVRNPMLQRFMDLGLPVIKEPTEIRPLSFDAVYFQHQVAGLFDYSRHAGDPVPEGDRTLVVMGRLSPTGLLESGGWAHEAAIADLHLANSPETARAMVEAGVKEPIRVFGNAAPARFHQPRAGLPATPGSILFITNHQTPEMLDAVQRLRAVAKVEHVGRSGDQVAPVTEAMVAHADVVVTIGKSVQYALAAGAPVFVYDLHGGPGYLNAGNFEVAADLNFSGRCTPQKRTGADLASAILAGYEDARRSAEALRLKARQAFFLPDHLDALLRTPGTDNAVRRRRLAQLNGAMARERMLAAYIRESHIHHQRLSRARSTTG